MPPDVAALLNAQAKQMSDTQARTGFAEWPEAGQHQMYLTGIDIDWSAEFDYADSKEAKKNPTKLRCYAIQFGFEEVNGTAPGGKAYKFPGNKLVIPYPKADGSPPFKPHTKGSGGNAWILEDALGRLKGNFEGIFEDTTEFEDNPYLMLSVISNMLEAAAAEDRQISCVVKIDKRTRSYESRDRTGTVIKDAEGNPEMRTATDRHATILSLDDGEDLRDAAISALST